MLSYNKVVCIEERDREIITKNSLKSAVTHQTPVWVEIISCSLVSQNSCDKYLQYKEAERSFK